MMCPCSSTSSTWSVFLADGADMAAFLRVRASHRYSSDRPPNLPNLRQLQRLAVSLHHGHSQRLMVGPAQPGVGGDQLDGVGAGLLQNLEVREQVAEAQVGDTVLPGAEEVAQAALPGVLLGQGEAVGGAAHGAEALLGFVGGRVGEQIAFAGD